MSSLSRYRIRLRSRDVFLYTLSLLLLLQSYNDFHGKPALFQSARTIYTAGNLLSAPTNHMKDLLEHHLLSTSQHHQNLVLITADSSVDFEKAHPKLLQKSPSTQISATFLPKPMSVNVFRHYLNDGKPEIMILLPDGDIVPNIQPKTFKRLVDAYIMVLDTVAKNLATETSLTVGVLEGVDKAISYCSTFTPNLRPSTGHLSRILKKTNYVLLRQLLLINLQKYAHVFADNHKANILPLTMS